MQLRSTLVHAAAKCNLSRPSAIASTAHATQLQSTRLRWPCLEHWEVADCGAHAAPAHPSVHPQSKAVMHSAGWHYDI